MVSLTPIREAAKLGGFMSKMEQVVKRIYSCRNMQEEDFKQEILNEVEPVFNNVVQYRAALNSILQFTKDERIKNIVEGVLRG